MDAAMIRHFCAIVLVTALISSSVSAVKYPVILLPGDGGSQLWAKLNKTSVSNGCTNVTSSYKLQWVDATGMIFGRKKCIEDNIRLVYDNKTRTTHNAPGVDVITPHFGNTTAIETLDPYYWNWITPNHYFKDMVDALVKWGYKRGISVLGAPYDFRKAPNEMQAFFRDLQQLIENASVTNNNSRVVLVTHSMGSLMALYFFNHLSQTWKDKYIRAFVPISGPWTGSLNALMAEISGYKVGILIGARSLRIVERSFPGMAWLMPSDKSWTSKETLVVTRNRNYTTADYEQLFLDIKYREGYEMRKDTEGLVRDLIPPGVEVHCLHGEGFATATQLRYLSDSKSGWWNEDPDEVDGPGDGTVNLRSLKACLRWQKVQKQPFYYKTFKFSHLDIVRNQQVFEYLRKLL